MNKRPILAVSIMDQTAITVRGRGHSCVVLAWMSGMRGFSAPFAKTARSENVQHLCTYFLSANVGHFSFLNLGVMRRVFAPTASRLHVLRLWYGCSPFPAFLVRLGARNTPTYPVIRCPVSF